MTSKQTVTIGGIPVEIIRKKSLKNLYIRVNPPEGDVTVSSPLDVTDEELKLHVLKKLPEITKIRNRMISQERQSKREYVSGESCHLWGKPYRLQVIYKGNKRNIEKTPSKIILTVPNGTDDASREKIITEWYREELKRALVGVTEQAQKTTGIQADEFRVKNMRTRWGTCNIEKRRIWINLQLVKKPVECLEYVVIHELVHLVERNHTHRFYALVEEYCPKWKDARQLLQKLPLDYIEKGDSDTDAEPSDTE